MMRMILASPACATTPPASVASALTAALHALAALLRSAALAAPAVAEVFTAGFLEHVRVLFEMMVIPIVIAAFVTAAFLLF
jgi:hypothetical protein